MNLGAKSGGREDSGEMKGTGMEVGFIKMHYILA